MNLSDFYYELPPELIAHYPTPARTASRLLCLEGNTITHQHFADVIELLVPGDLLVMNNTRVIPARLLGHKASGGRVEVLIERIREDGVLAHVRASKAPKIGARLNVGVEVEVIGRENDLFILKFLDPRPVLIILNEIGHMPLPPYIARADENSDRERYQTVYAQQPGAIAAPTAGLHFDETLLKKIKDKGVDIAFVTLHVGAGTFQPVRVENIEDHKMHAEYVEVSEEVCEKVRKAKRVIAVGTTSVRCLETAAQNGKIQPFKGDTQIFIYPGYQFRCVDVLITNFHLPQSTLLMLVCAFAGYEQAMVAYQEAIKQKYRFYSYGDAMWITK